MDILFACDSNKSRPWFRDRIPAIERAIDELNLDIKICDIYSLLNHNIYDPSNIDERRLFLQCENLDKANEEFKREILNINPKVLILGTADNYCQFLYYRTVLDIRKNGTKVVGILGDDEFNYHQYQFFMGWFDLFVGYVKPSVDYYESFNITEGYFFPNSCYLEQKDFSNLSQKTEFDAVLIGAPIANRVEMVQALIERGISIGIFGSKQWLEYPKISSYYHGFVATEDFDSTLSKGKIVLAFLEDHISGNLHMNTKIWEAARVGRIPIATEYSRLSEDYFLYDSINILTYKNIEELVKKVRIYSTDDNKRLKIAEDFYNHIRDNFNYSDMYKEFFNFVYTRENEEVLDFSISDKISELKFWRISNIENEIIITNILSHVEVVKKLVSEGKKIDCIYYDRVENGKRTISRGPFVNITNVIFLNGKQLGRFSARIIFVFYFFKRTALHINQFGIKSSRETFIGIINRRIDKFITRSKIGIKIKRKLLNIKLRSRSKI